MAINMSNLPEKTTVANSDVLMVENTTATNKVTKENLLKEINNTKIDDVQISGTN